MSRYLVLSFRFLAPWFHGRGDGGIPEWPPSPLRVFQAIVASAARAGKLEVTGDALTWLERLEAPLVMASEAVAVALGYRLSVPHNEMDLVGKQWAAGKEGDVAKHRAMKNVRPHHLSGDSVVHYAWRSDGEASNEQTIITATRNVVALGWGLDLVVGDGAIIDSERLDNFTSNVNVWEPRYDGDKKLRVPISGTLDDLCRRHSAFTSRISFATPTLRPPPALSTFSAARYALTTRPRTTEVAAFTLMRVDSDNFRAFPTARRGMAVAGMLRHAMRSAAEYAGWEESRIHSTVLGHGDGNHNRLLLVPVPSIEPRGSGSESVGAIRRVMVFSTDDRCGDTRWAARVLGGRDIIDERTGEVQAVISAATRHDRVISRYVAESSTWVSVTPVVLPGHDDPGGIREKLRGTNGGHEPKSLIDRLMKRREALVRKALRHAGLGDELAFSAVIEIRESGFIAGVEQASRYAVPSHLANAPRYHVKLTWPVKVAGPICIGSGRFSGLGLLTSVNA